MVPAQVIGDYHKNDPAYAESHTNDWDASGVGEGGVLDLSKLGLAEELSMRVRVGRNLKSFNLPGAMDKAERIAFEIKCNAAFEAVKAKFGGSVYSISPDLGEGVEHPNKIDDAKYEELVKAHVMFKDMDADPYARWAETRRGAAAATTWTVRGDESRRRRGGDAARPQRRIAATHRRRRGSSRERRAVEPRSSPPGTSSRRASRRTGRTAAGAGSRTTSRRSSGSARRTSSASWS